MTYSPRRLRTAAVFAQKQQAQVSATQPNYSPSQATMNAPPNPNEVDKELANIFARDIENVMMVPHESIVERDDRTLVFAVVESEDEETPDIVKWRYEIVRTWFFPK